MDAQTMEHLRTKLLNRREMWLGRRGRVLAEHQALPIAAQPGRHPSTAAQPELAPQDGLGQLETQALERIEASLDRIEKGTYGKCVVCRGAIETDRQRALPDDTRSGGSTH